MLLECGAPSWDVAQQLGHTDGGQLVAGARARLLAAWDAQIGAPAALGIAPGQKAS